MIWVLFIIVLDAEQYYVSPNSFYSSMDKCFAARQGFMKTAPQPKVNYEAVCIKTDRVKLQ
jgi:hypothetical protein